MNRESQETTPEKFPLTGVESPAYGQPLSGRGDKGKQHAAAHLFPDSGKWHDKQAYRSVTATTQL